jgi:predicted NAD/FAD-binding protein
VRIAIVGTGVAGLAAAWLLASRHAVTVFEAARHLGGHVNTTTVEHNGLDLPVDTDFIVFNEHNYPLLTKLLKHLGVPSETSSMSFAASIGDGALEWGGGSLPAFLAQPRNLARPAFLRMLAEIARFNRAGERFLCQPAGGEPSLAEFLDRHGFGRGLREWYLLPMTAAIWSAPVARILEVPARSLLAFLAQHGLLRLGRRHRWRTVKGGARQYVERMAAGFRPRIRLATPIRGVRRRPWGVELLDARGERSRFDRVVLACHADQSLAILEDATPAERSLLGAFRFQPNRAVLHGDPALMPRRRAVWSSWNYLAPGRLDPQARVSVTYWMNRLQRLDPDPPLFVSLNPLREPDPSLAHAAFAYRHPVFDGAALAAQRRFGQIQGQGGVWYAGAWLGHGFHEGGLRAGLAVAQALGAALPWEPSSLPSLPGGLSMPMGTAAGPA